MKRTRTRKPKCPHCRGLLIQFVTDPKMHWCNRCGDPKRPKTPPAGSGELGEA